MNRRQAARNLAETILADILNGRRCWCGADPCLAEVCKEGCPVNVYKKACRDATQAKWLYEMPPIVMSVKQYQNDPGIAFSYASEGRNVEIMQDDRVVMRLGACVDFDDIYGEE